MFSIIIWKEHEFIRNIYQFLFTSENNDWLTESSESFSPKFFKIQLLITQVLPFNLFLGLCFSIFSQISQLRTKLTRLEAPVPMALHAAIEAEIKKLMAEGTWQPADSANWATPIVPVGKASWHPPVRRLKLHAEPAIASDTASISRVRWSLASLVGAIKIPKSIFPTLTSFLAFSENRLNRQSCLFSWAQPHMRVV